MKNIVDTLHYSNDTFLYIVNLSPITTQVDNKPYCYLTLNEVITLLLAVTSVIVAVVQFKKQMTKNREEQKNANIKNWFLSVIVLPQIEGINMFYLKLIEDVLEDISIFPSVASNNFVLLSEKQAVRKEQINAFFDHLQSLIRSFDIPLSQKIAIEVQNLEDEVTIILAGCFGRRLYTKDEIRRRLLLNKKDIIAILYSKTLEDDMVIK